MFSEAYTLLNRALNYTQSQRQDFNLIRDVLKSAKSAVLSDDTQPERLKRLASIKIDNAISYTYSRTNPYPAFSPRSFQSMVSTPISPFQRPHQGPYGFVKGPIVPGHPELVPTDWTTKQRETTALAMMIREALTIVRRGLH
jgi:hypothetical protein